MNRRLVPLWSLYATVHGIPNRYRSAKRIYDGQKEEIWRRGMERLRAKRAEDYALLAALNQQAGMHSGNQIQHYQRLANFQSQTNTIGQYSLLGNYAQSSSSLFANLFGF